VTEFLVLLLLVLAGGVLAGAEMAIVTARRGRLERLAGQGSARARAALQLRADPERFLASVQIGITLLGAIAGAFGGRTLAARLEPLLRWLGCGEASGEVAFAVVVVAITYLSVVFGELVPKSLALRFADGFAVAIARPMVLLGWLARPFVWLLTASSNLVLRAFHDRTNFVEAKVTREDLEHLVEQAAEGGGLDAGTGDLVERALGFSQLRVADVMVPRRFVRAVAADAGIEQLREAMLGAGHRRVPVYEGSIDNVVGYVLREDVLACLWDGRAPRLDTLRRDPYFVPDLMPLERALRELQQRQLHLAVVVDEHGATAGIVTVEDVVEELVGKIFHERDAVPQRPIQREAEGQWLVQGTVPLRDVWRETDVELPETGESRTVGGLLVALAGDRVPVAGEKFAAGPHAEFEVVEASLRRVRTARLRRR